MRLESSDRMFPEEILKFHPELQSFLDEIEKKGWRYLYIETKGTAVAEIDLDGLQYRIRRDGTDHPLFRSSAMGVGQTMLEIAIGQRTPKLSGVPEAGIFRINVSTKSFPQAVTVDITKGLVTYLNDAFWGWQKEWERDEKKLSEAKEVHEVAEWLLEVKKQKLHESYNVDRYNEISRLLQEQ